MRGATVMDRAIDQYYEQLADYDGRHVSHETAVRSAFQQLVDDCAPDGWKLIPEQKLDGSRRHPDGTLRDNFNLPRGYWEAKDTHDDLATEIRKKITAGYPINNTIFEDTRAAVLYQGGRVVFEASLSDRRQLADLLRAFFTYEEPVIGSFHAAVAEFRERIPDLAKGLTQRIKDEHQAHNPAFARAWATFYEVCRSSLNPNLTSEAVDEMLVQHLLTERLFRTVFDNPDFVSRNAIAAEIEKVIKALTSRAFNRTEFLRQLDRFYVAIENTARGLRDWSEKQAFMNMVYERFFQGFSVKQADTHGIVYTPQAIVDFMCASVEEVLRDEFGTSLAAPGVRVLDPATGTGNFIVNLLRRISLSALEHKYRQDLFANEIMLLPYYIASLNIEHAYYDLTGRYLPFEGICFADTLELADPAASQGARTVSLWMNEANTERVRREEQAPIMVVIGNPPYNVGQENENDNNKNRKYPVIDGRIRETYAKDSRATNKNALSDAYVKFFRWATDRLQGRDGVVCLVTNNSFVDQIAFDGMRAHLERDFTAIYHLDLHGNVRKNPKLSGTAHNVFGIQVGVGITVAVRAKDSARRGIFYYRVPEDWRKEEKCRFLAERGSLTGIEWEQMQPNDKHVWLTEGMRAEYDDFLPVGTQEAKAATSGAEAIFQNYGGGAKTNRDQWAYDFSPTALAAKVKRFIETYNAEVDRWKRRGAETASVDDFVTYDDTRIKWSRDLKLDLQRGHYATFAESKVRQALYRPFCTQWLFFDRILNEEVYQFPQFFPTPAAESENRVICVPGLGDRKGFGTLVTNMIPSLDLAFEKAQCFPYYVYNEDGSGRRENITDWALERFQAAYGPGVTKERIFAYVYGMLHHPAYRERYAENLKRELPRIPLLPGAVAFETVARTGGELMALHLGYERAELYPLAKKETPGEKLSWRVERKMRLSPDKTALAYNDWLTLEGIPPDVYEYRLGNRSALEWVIDQYHVSADARSGIVSDPNRPDDERYIVHLIPRVVTVSVKTVALVRQLAATVDLSPVFAEGSSPPVPLPVRG